MRVGTGGWERCVAGNVLSASILIVCVKESRNPQLSGVVVMASRLRFMYTSSPDSGRTS